MLFILLGALFGGLGGGALGGTVVGLLGLEIAGGVIAGGAVGMIGGGALGGVLNENCGLRERDRQTRIQLRDLRQSLNEARRERDELNLEIGRINVEINLLNVRINALVVGNARLRDRVRDLEADRAASQRQLQQKNREINQLRREIDELNAGDGISARSYGEANRDVWYSLTTLFDFLQKVIPLKFPGFLTWNKLLISNELIDKSGLSHIAVILPPLVAVNGHLIFTTKNALANLDISQSDISPLQLFLSRYLIKNLDTPSYAKILFPFLDMSKKHWLTAELKLIQKEDKNFELIAHLHDPRGGGLFALQDLQILSAAIESCLKEKWPNAKLKSHRISSPYQSCRQSTPDRISCGPIVLKEISLRIKDRNLDRRIPYQYGASEIVQRQNKVYKTCVKDRTDSLSVIATGRYRFLSRIMGKNNQKEVVPQEIAREVECKLI